jgi:hypothetical protein
LPLDYNQLIGKYFHFNLEIGTFFHYLYAIKNNQKYLEMTISEKAISEIKKSNRIMGRLMIAFDRGQNTIENWLVSKDIRLTTPTAVQIISEESELTEADILETETAGS